MTAYRYRGSMVDLYVCLDDETPIGERPVSLQSLAHGSTALTTAEARAVAAALIASADEADAAYAAEPPARRTKPEKLAARKVLASVRGTVPSRPMSAGNPFGIMFYRAVRAGLWGGQWRMEKEAGGMYRLCRVADGVDTGEVIEASPFTSLGFVQHAIRDAGFVPPAADDWRMP